MRAHARERTYFARAVSRRSQRVFLNSEEEVSESPVQERHQDREQGAVVAVTAAVARNGSREATAVLLFPSKLDCLREKAERLVRAALVAV